MMRRPAFAGKFYPSSESELSEAVSRFISSAKVAKSASSAISYVSPHAGYRYSGSVAGFTYKALSMRKDLAAADTFVIVGPNHTGRGYRVSVSASDWRTPLGIVRNDSELTERMASQSGYLNIDETAHAEEHSIEVQLPFLQKIVNNPRCCFVCMGDQTVEASKAVAESIDSAAGSLHRKVVVLASSDLDHYEPEEVARRKDMGAFKALEKLDFGKFHSTMARLDDSACGYGPITVAGMFAQMHGATRASMLRYATSADVTKDYKAVVAYSSIVFS